MTEAIWSDAKRDRHAPLGLAMETVLLISVDFPPQTDGVSSISEAVARKLAADGYRLCVIGPKSLSDRT